MDMKRTQSPPCLARQLHLSQKRATARGLISCEIIWHFLTLVGATCILSDSSGAVAHLTFGIMLFRLGGVGQKLRDGPALVLFGLVFHQAMVAAVWPRRVSLISVRDQLTRRVVQNRWLVTPDWRTCAPCDNAAPPRSFMAHRY
jgi:hypothetical protein